MVNEQKQNVVQACNVILEHMADFRRLDISGCEAGDTAVPGQEVIKGFNYCETKPREIGKWAMRLWNYTKNAHVRLSISKHFKDWIWIELNCLRFS